jgi:hypothetical protein
MAGIHKAALGAAAAMALVRPALADNEQLNLYAVSCLPGQACNIDRGNGSAATESYATASGSGANGGLVTAQVGFSPNAETLGGTFLNNASADFSYTFQIQGAAGVIVPLHVYGYASISSILASTFNSGQLTVGSDGTPSGTTPFSITSGVSIDITGIHSIDSFGNVSQTAAHVDAGNSSDNLDLVAKSVLIDQTLYFQSNTDISVDIFAGATLRFNDDGGRSGIFGSVSASADPVFTITDPAFSAFRLVGVPGDAPPVGGAVPEPASWALMILGFGMTGYRMRRRKVAFG